MRGLWGAVALSFLTCTAVFAAEPELSFASIRTWIAAQVPEVSFITPEALARALEDEARAPRLLDARSEAEFAVSHLRGATRIDPDHPELLPLRAERAAPFVVYCSVGLRSAYVARAMLQGGFRDVKNLEGGIFAWANRGYPVHHGAQRVDRVHPYDALWRRLLKEPLRAPLVR
jgi:rhodanese-related sulfurtransferase